MKFRENVMLLEWKREKKLEKWKNFSGWREGEDVREL